MMYVVLLVVVVYNYGKIIFYIYMFIIVYNEIFYVNLFFINFMVIYILLCILFYIYFRGLNILDNYLYMV